MNRPKIKVCGLKTNAPAVIGLEPNYVGFIFFKGSSRYFEGLPPEVAAGIGKVGVFVNHDLEQILAKVEQFQLDVVQLHGEESNRFAADLRGILIEQGMESTKIWKAFGVDADFDFSRIQAYTSSIDAVLLDTKGILRGGNGIPFDWNLLKDYQSDLPIVLSGGIGPESVPEIKQLLKSDLPIEVIDINSRFEIEPGFKNIQHIKNFIDELSR